MPEEFSSSTIAVINQEIAEQWQEKKQPVFNAIPIKDVPAYRSFEELDDETISADQNYVLMDLEQNPDNLKYPNISDAQDRVTGLASHAYFCCIDYEDMFKPTTLSGLATISRMIEIQNQPEGTYSPEMAVNDFYGEVRIDATRTLIGTDRLGGKNIAWLDYYKRKDFPAFYTHLSHYAPNFSQACENTVTQMKNACTPERLASIALTEQYIMDKIEEGLNTHPAVAEDWYPIIDLIDELKANECKTSGNIRFLIYKFQDFEKSIPDSEVAKLVHSPENEALVEALSPFVRGFDTNEEQIREMFTRCKKYIDVVPNCQPFIQQLSEAVMKDAEKIGAMVDKAPGESDVAYMQRIVNMIEGNVTDIEKEIVNFIDSHGNEIDENPFVLLGKISELCGVELKAAVGGTPHTMIVDQLAHELDEGLQDAAIREIQNDPGAMPIFPFPVAPEPDYAVVGSDIVPEPSQLGEVQVQMPVDIPRQSHIIEAQPIEDVVKRRILVAIEGGDHLEEFNYLSGDSKADYPLNGPDAMMNWANVNTLTLDQYRKFNTAMRALSMNVNWKQSIRGK